MNDSGLLSAGRPLATVPDRNVVICRAKLLPYSETFIREQAKAYSRWRPILCGEFLAEELSLDGLEVRLLQARPASIPSRLASRIRRELRLPQQRMADLIRSLNPSVIHVHFGTDAVRMWPTLRALSAPVVVTLHGYDINIYKEFWQGDRTFRDYPERLIEISFHDSVRFVAVSEAIKRRAVEFGLPADKIHVRYIGVDLGQFEPLGLPVEERPPVILYIGRFVEKKGGQYLIRAFAELHKSIPECRLWMVGDGPLLDEFKAMAAEQQQPVEFLGRCDSAQIRALFAKVRVCCLPSVTAENGDAEGLPTVAVEAQACGVPVVTSARGAVTEGIEDGETGFAFPERDVERLVARLRTVLEDAPTARRMSCRAPALMRERFDIVQCTAALESLYDDIVARRA